MANYPRVLVALALAEDENARALLDKARHQTQKDCIHIAHIEEHPVTGMGDITGKNHLVNETQIRQSVFPGLQKLAEPLKLPADNIHIAFGDPAQEIHLLAQKLDCSLIIIGHHKKRGLLGFIHTTTGDIVKNAEVDVLTVHSG